MVLKPPLEALSIQMFLFILEKSKIFLLAIGRSYRPMCIFDKFYLTFNFKSRVSHDVFKNKNECQLTCTLYSKLSPQFWVT